MRTSRASVPLFQRVQARFGVRISLRPDASHRVQLWHDSAAMSFEPWELADAIRLLTDALADETARGEAQPTLPL